MTLFSRKKRFAVARAFSSVALTGFTLLASGSLLAPAHAWSYTTTVLGMAGADINNSNLVVGTGPTSPPSSFIKMWTWDPTYGAVDRGFLGTYPGAQATAVTDTTPTRIVGHAYAPGPDSFNGAYWTVTGTTPPTYSATSLSPIFSSSGYATHANGADDANGIAGYVKLQPPAFSPPAQACWWLANSTTPIPSPNTITSYGASVANDILGYSAGSHNVVGWGSLHPTTISKRAFVAVVNDSGITPVVTELFPADTSIQSEAIAINSYGSIVGNRNGHAFVFVPFTAQGTTGTITFLSETPSGGSTGTGSSIADINDNGTIVGTFTNSSGIMRTARWDAPYSGNVIDLNSVVSLGLYNGAKAINSSGNIVVGGVANNSMLLTYHP